MKYLLPACMLVLGGAVTAPAQAPLPEPPTLDQPIVLSQAAPLLSLEQQVRGAGFDQRGSLATAFDQANQAVDAKVAELRSRGLLFPDEAETNLENARIRGRQAFRDMSLTTEETWQTARENAVLAMRQLRGALQDMERFATVPRA